MPRVAIGLEYDGTDFLGWQAQAHGPTVQAAVEAAVSTVADEPVRIHGSGRTDTGVHAAGQVAHFDASCRRSERQWLLGVNSNLPDSVAVTWVREVPSAFDARRSAQWREYRYTILSQPTRPVLGRRTAWWVRDELNLAVMSQAASMWLGERDFSAFRAAHCQSTTPMRNLMRIGFSRSGGRIDLTFRANAFVYHMVRNTVGTLVDIGTGRIGLAEAANLLPQRDRSRAGATAPACGLTLAAIDFGPAHAVPRPMAIDV